MTEATLTWSIWQALLNAFACCFTRRGFRRFAEWITALAINVRAYAPAWNVWVLWEKIGLSLLYSSTGRESEIFCTIDCQDNSTSSGTSTP
jgi:hypothetical protein